MSTNISTIEEVLISGNLANLSPGQRVEYYNKLCEFLKINPLTKPFAYISLNGKLCLYALKDCTDQLRNVRGISIYKMESKTENDVHIVTAYARDAQGREDVAIGAVTIAGLKGEALANAYMKTETKAKRRVTLSIGGLGMLDETEIESIKNVSPKSVGTTTIEHEPLLEPKLVTGDELFNKVCEKIKALKNEADLVEFEEWKLVNKASLHSLVSIKPELAITFRELLAEQKEKFVAHIPSAPINGYGQPLSFN